VVRKTDDGHVTASGVAAVTGDERLRELARMMTGTPDSDIAVEHARELLQQARPGHVH
jgi:DNA repair protein RecN (Recombination protein N)